MAEQKFQPKLFIKTYLPVSPSNKIGILVLSAINSATSTTYVQEASLQSRTPSYAEMDKPLAQIPIIVF